MPSQPKRPSRSVAARLTAKVGPLPVWGWAAVILGAYLLWQRRSASGGAASSSTPVTAGDGSTGGAQVPASGQGAPGDNVSSQLADRIDVNTSALDSLTTQLLSMPTPYSNFGDGPLVGAPAGDTGQGTGPAASPTVAPAAAPTATQTASGSLRWGGLTFTSKSAFDSWAKAHGSSTQAELRNHPQARALYSTLR